MIYLKIGLLSIATILTVQCSAQKQSDNKNAVEASAVSKMNIQKIVLEEMTRGSRRMVTITPTLKIVEVNRQIKQMKMETSEWNALLRHLSSQNLSLFETYVSPATKRYYDGAFSADMKITVGDKVYNSQSFDSGTPPKEFSELYFAVAGSFKDR